MRLRTLPLLGLAALSAFGPVAFASSAGIQPQSIYGADSRQDLYQVTSPLQKRLADSTVALVKSTRVLHSFEGYTRLDADSYGESQGLCSSERFYSQNAAAFCSGSLVGPDLVLTAGHCVTSQASCEGTKFVFGYGIRSPGQDPARVKTSDIYGCASIVSHRLDAFGGADYAVIKLDRSVTGHRPVGINRSGRLQNGTRLLMIGHPSGLPTKVADGRVIDNTLQGYFLTTLDAFAGNSGSSVFNASTGLIEGILVRGASDFEIDRQNMCMRAARYPDNGGNFGESVTQISVAASSIPVIRTQTVPSPVETPPSPPAVPAGACLRRSYTYEISNITVQGEMPTTVEQLSEAIREQLSEIVRKIAHGIPLESTQIHRIAFLEQTLLPENPACRDQSSGDRSEDWQKLTGFGIIANSSRDMNDRLVPGYREINRNRLYLLKTVTSKP